MLDIHIFDEVLKTHRVNITEYPEWKKVWESAEGDWVGNAAWADWQGITMDSNLLDGYVYDLIKAAYSKGNRTRSRLENLRNTDALLDAVKCSDGFESTRQVIMDTLEFMYQDAAMPRDGDISVSVEDAGVTFVTRHLSYYWRLIAAKNLPPTGVKEWRPDQEKFEMTFGGVQKQLLAEIRYEHKENEYDRFLVFDFGNSWVIHRLIAKIRGHPDEEVGETMAADLENDLEEARQDFIRDFFKSFVRTTGNIDVSNRTDFHLEWLKTLARTDWRAGVRKEFEAFLKEETE